MKGPSLLVLPVFPVIALTVPAGNAASSADPSLERACRWLRTARGRRHGGVVRLGYLKGDALGEVGDRFRRFLVVGRVLSGGDAFLRFDRTRSAQPDAAGRMVLFLAVVPSASRAPFTVSALYLASALWGGWWLLVWSANTYFPGRYLVHFIVPAAIHIMAGLSLGDRDTLARIVASSGRSHAAPTCDVLLLWLVCPRRSSCRVSSAGLASLAAGMSSVCRSGSSSDRCLTGLMACVAASRPSDERSIVGFPVVSRASDALLARRTRVRRSFTGSGPSIQLPTLPSGAQPRPPRSRSVSFWRRNRACASGRPHCGRSRHRLAGDHFLGAGGAAILFPTYSLRDASRDLAQYLPVGSCRFEP